MRRFGIVLAAAGIALVAAAGPAWAHVKVEPESAPQGSDAVLAFVVPNEMSNATTTKVVVTFPRDHPITQALVEAIPGWKGEAAAFTLKTPIVTSDGSFKTAVMLPPTPMVRSTIPLMSASRAREAVDSASATSNTSSIRRS